jgi:hypothetical protein
MKTTARLRGSSLPAAPEPEATEEDILAVHMEAKFLDGWMAYTLKNNHTHVPLRKGMTVLVQLKKGLMRRGFATVKYPSKRWVKGERVELYEFTYPKTNYWWWPGLEDEQHARATRERRMRGTNKKRPLKPY